MDKKYNKEKHLIQSNSELFANYLKTQLELHHAWDFFLSLSAHAPVFVFSGVTRNFFIGFHTIRDIDLVVDSEDLYSLVTSYLPQDTEIRVNSFGGLKIQIEYLNFDIWSLTKTWGIQKKNLKPTFNSLLNTSFFNFSAIVYDWSRQKFWYTERFCEFLRKKTMDVVFSDNPNKPLCILNSLYYNYYYGFYIGHGLCKWIAQNYDNSMNFEIPQQKHWGYRIFSDSVIESFVEECKKAARGNHALTINLLINK